MFTAQPVVDLNAFAPRNYACDAQKAGAGTTDVSRWYQRCENNGWKVVGGAMMAPHLRAQVEEAVAESQKVAVYYHPNREVRKVEQERRRKQRRVQWMTQLYDKGEREERERRRAAREAEEAKEQTMDLFSVTQAMDDLIGRGASTPVDEAAEASDEEWEEGVQAMVSWAAELDFDRYQTHWGRAGKTRTARRP